MDPGAAANEDLDPQGEGEWSRLERQIELAEGFWLGFVFSPSPRDALVLQRRAARELKAKRKVLVDLLPSDPAELRALLRVLPARDDVALAGCTWVHCLREDAPSSPSPEWTPAWDDLFLRLNERRDALRGRLRGGLVFAAPPSVKPRIREAAPDLWSVRGIVVEIAPVSQRDSDLILHPSLGVESTEPNVLPHSPDPVFALAEAKRRSDMALSTSAQAGNAASKQEDLKGTAGGRSVAYALLEAAEGLFSQARVGEAVEAATKAFQLFGGSDPLGETRALALRAEAEDARGNDDLAFLCIEDALERRRHHAPYAVPREWYELAGRLAMKRGELQRALAYFENAARVFRIRDPSQARPEALMRLVSALSHVAEAHRALGELTAAADVLREAIAVTRQWSSIDESGGVLYELVSELVTLGDINVEAGQIVAAIAAFDEAVLVSRQSCARASDHPFALRGLSIALNRAGNARAAGDEFEAATAAFDESLELRRRIVETQGETQATLRDLSSSLRRLSRARWRAGDHARATSLAESALGAEHRLYALRLSARGPSGVTASETASGEDESLRRSEAALLSIADIARELETAEEAARTSGLRQRALLLLASVRRERGDELGARNAEEDAAEATGKS